MSQPSGHGAHIDAGTDQLRGGEVAEIMKSHLKQTEGVSNSGEEPSDVVRPEWFGTVHRMRKHISVRHHSRASLLSPLLNLRPMAYEQGDTNVIKGNHPKAVSLRRLLGQTGRHDDQGPRHIEFSSLEIYVRPTEGA